MNAYKQLEDEGLVFQKLGENLIYVATCDRCRLVVMIGFEMVIIGGIFIRSKSQHNFGKYQLEEAMQPTITKVRGIEVGHWTDLDAATGCTVIVCRQGAVGGVDVRGSAPGTRETDFLRPVNLMQKAHAIVLSGGSAYGLDAASGVMRWLEEQGIGFNVDVAIGPSRSLSCTFRPDHWSAKCTAWSGGRLRRLSVSDKWTGRGRLCRRGDRCYSWQIAGAPVWHKKWTRFSSTPYRWRYHGGSYSSGQCLW